MQQSAFQISFHPDQKIDNWFFNRSIMAHTQMWGPRTGIFIFGTVSQTEKLTTFSFICGAGLI